MLSPKEFINIGNTISKYTHSLDSNLEEHQIGVTIPSEEEGSLSESCDLSETARNIVRITPLFDRDGQETGWSKIEVKYITNKNEWRSVLWKNQLNMTNY